MFFGGFECDFQEAEFIVIGVPFDKTSTFKSGAKFAPNSIRKAAYNIETYSFRTNIDVDDLKIYDAGNLTTLSTVESMINGLSATISEIIKLNKIPVVIGGEHTLTYGIVKALKNCGIIIFDAHLDLRDEYPLNIKFSHATVTRRISELISCKKILCLGTRAVCKEEIKYAKDHELRYITSYEINEKNLDEIIDIINFKIREMDVDNLWISIDLDVLDPSIAPEVSNPEPEGINTKTLLDILMRVINDKVAGFDIVELVPQEVNSITAIQAAKIIFETICLIHKSKL